MMDDVHLAKRVKLFPNEFLGEFNTSVWVDGKFQIIGDFNEYISTYQYRQPILCFPHFSRNCLYDEAAVCVTSGKGDKRDIIPQVSSYEREGYPFDNGLYEMGCIVRKHNDPFVSNLMEEWWEEVCRFSYRDQISFPYVRWKNGFIPDICDQNLYRNRWLLHKGHCY